MVHSKKTEIDCANLTGRELEQKLRPIELPDPQNSLITTESNARIYTEKLHDHFGVRQPVDAVKRWPKLGIRVPYEPRT